VCVNAELHDEYSIWTRRSRRRRLWRRRWYVTSVRWLLGRRRYVTSIRWIFGRRWYVTSIRWLLGILKAINGKLTVIQSPQWWSIVPSLEPSVPTKPGRWKRSKTFDSTW
jgi:hypothetical protein